MLDLSKYVDESLSRYVTIGISCDVSENVRACKLEVKSGTAATGPAIPVFLKGGAKSIIDGNIRDIRADEKKCGYGQVYTASTTPITVKSGTAIAVTAQSGVTEKGAMYLIPTAGKSDSDTVQNYIYTSVTTGNCVELPFYWLYCDTFITGLTACDSAADGEYYLCWVGRSNNSHPIVREVKVMN